VSMELARKPTSSASTTEISASEPKIVVSDSSLAAPPTPAENCQNGYDVSPSIALPNLWRGDA